MTLYSRYFCDCMLYPITTVACAHLHAHESTALAEVSFGPVWGQLNGAFSVSQGLRVLLQAVIAIGTVPKEPVVLWITFDGFCKHSDCLCVLPLLHQFYPFFC